MRKIALCSLAIALIALTTSLACASTVPDKILKTKMVTANEVITTGGGYLVYSFKVYAATAANAAASLADANTFGTASTAVTKVENGEADQYNLSPGGDFEWPVEFETGLVCVLGPGAYAIIQYED